jgi:hypothetical protein
MFAERAHGDQRDRYEQGRFAPLYANFCRAGARVNALLACKGASHPCISMFAERADINVLNY